MKVTKNICHSLDRGNLSSSGDFILIRRISLNQESDDQEIFPITKDLLNMGLAFKYGVREFLIHDLTPETQLLAAIVHGTDLNFLCITDQLHIICNRKIL